MPGPQPAPIQERPWRLARQGQTDITFTGTRVVSVSTRGSADDTVWTECNVYRTHAGKYVLEYRHIDLDPAGRSFSTVDVFNAAAEVVEFARQRLHPAIAKDIAQGLGVDIAEKLD